VSRVRAARLRLTIAVLVTLIGVLILSIGPADRPGTRTWDTCVGEVWLSGETTDANFQACDREFGIDAPMW
jgi:hypothetical protein